MLGQGVVNGTARGERVDMDVLRGTGVAAEDRGMLARHFEAHFAREAASRHPLLFPSIVWRPRR